mmetsp:Transcript_36442/g.95747  ORF Transcript_36442/g.95747 Transcript_36442/m.95747 type:complete len:211 (-) Transcript_36442:742-1374(-)
MNKQKQRAGSTEATRHLNPLEEKPKGIKFLKGDIRTPPRHSRRKDAGTYALKSARGLTSTGPGSSCRVGAANTKASRGSTAAASIPPASSDPAELIRPWRDRRPRDDECSRRPLESGGPGPPAPGPPGGSTVRQAGSRSVYAELVTEEGSIESVECSSRGLGKTSGRRGASNTGCAATFKLRSPEEHFLIACLTSSNHSRAGRGERKAQT